jgi:hypothetical protein
MAETSWQNTVARKQDYGRLDYGRRAQAGWQAGGRAVDDKTAPMHGKHRPIYIVACRRRLRGFHRNRSAEPKVTMAAAGERNGDQFAANDGRFDRSRRARAPDSLDAFACGMRARHTSIEPPAAA